ncbi:hypothetical protein FF1_035383 [Malus domestica]
MFSYFCDRQQQTAGQQQNAVLQQHAGRRAAAGAEVSHIFNKHIKKLSPHLPYLLVTFPDPQTNSHHHLCLHLRLLRYRVNVFIVSRSSFTFLMVLF